MEKARVVVVGGGVVGLSVLYHLARKGWTGLVLCEKAELASSATSRAAGHVILYTQNHTVSLLNRYSVELYKRLHAETGQDPGFHVCGNLRLATHRDRLLEFQRFMGLAELNRIPTRMLSAGEVVELWPFVERDGLLGGLFNPTDGHISPSDLAQSLAAGARRMGATIRRGTEVTGLAKSAHGDWRVETGSGAISAEHVVLCSGLHTQRLARLAGIAAHAIPIRHQYLLTGPIPELVERRRSGLPELPVMRDPERSYYMRQEGDGLLFGAYEDKPLTLFADGVPEGFTQDGFPGDLSVLEPYLETAIERVPLLARAGIRTLVPGVKPYSPDDLPIVGPAPGRDRLWLAEGNPFGVTLAGGVGHELAEWIVEGEPSIGMLACDPRRFGEYATRRYVAVKTEEAYVRTYLVPKPDEELPAARPLKTSPIHDVLAARGAVFGARSGWEVPLWFAPPAIAPSERYAYERSSYFEHVGRECLAVARSAGLADVSANGVFRISGPGAERVLTDFFRTPLPATAGACRTAIALTARQRVLTMMRVQRLSQDDFHLFCPPEADSYNLDLLGQACGRSAAEARLAHLTGRMGCLRISGPAAAEILARAGVAGDLLAARQGGAIILGLAPAHLVPVGDGFDLLAKSEFLRHLFAALQEAADGSLIPYGIRTAESMRLERGEPAWGIDVSTGQDAATLGIEARPESDGDRRRGETSRIAGEDVPRVTNRMVLLDLGGEPNFPPAGNEPVRAGGAPIGRVTSAGYAHNVARTYAIAEIQSSLAVVGTAVEVEIFTQRREATILRRIVCTSPDDLNRAGS